MLLTNAIMGLLSPVLWFAGMLLGVVMVVWWVRALDLEISSVVIVVGLIWVLGMMGSMAVVSIFGAVLLSPATLLIPDSLGTQTLAFDRNHDELISTVMLKAAQVVAPGWISTIQKASSRSVNR